MDIPKILLQKADEITEKLKLKYPELAPFFKGCFLNTIETTVTRLDDGGYFVITGDIPAMWLRDSASQLTHYIRYCNEDEDLKEIIRSVIARHAQFICLDPYANAFNAVPNSKSHKDDTDFQHELIWERKYEVDSLCASLYLAYQYYNETLDSSIFTEQFHRMMWKIVDLFKKEQNHFRNSTYYFNRTNCPTIDTLPNEGKGNDVLYTGMTWSGFRPSDDRCLYGYLVPSNMMAVCALKKAAQMANEGYEDTRLESECRSLAFDIDEGIMEHGVYDHDHYGKMFVYETDGMGNMLLMDDANSPSLLSAPYLGYVKPDNEIYKNTRKFILSHSNPWYFEGAVAKGVGSPHTGTDKIWHISLTMQALTSTDPEEIKDCIRMLTTTHAGAYLMHESFHKNDDTDFTRPWFAWANSLFAELMIRLADCGEATAI
ncbi:MAG: glycoside hydrolase family 125 protein [Clostridia bacterium]|nr:glycoside hydrolase family 125 protein [Clostridia bacterium]